MVFTPLEGAQVPGQAGIPLSVSSKSVTVNSNRLTATSGKKEASFVKSSESS